MATVCKTVCDKCGNEVPNYRDVITIQVMSSVAADNVINTRYELCPDDARKVVGVIIESGE